MGGILAGSTLKGVMLAGKGTVWEQEGAMNRPESGSRWGRGPNYKDENSVGWLRYEGGEAKPAAPKLIDLSNLWGKVIEESLAPQRRHNKKRAK